MVKIPPTILITETDFHNAWAKAIHLVLHDGKNMVIGNLLEKKPIKDACVFFELTGNAIKQIENKKIHPQFPFKYIDQYNYEFTREYLLKYIKKPKSKQFVYLYFERLVLYQSCFDQMAHLQKRLKKQIDMKILSNRDQAIIWDVKQDLNNELLPCLQRIWIRYLGDYNVEVHLIWRSRDLYTAWQANIIAIISMLNYEVIYPNHCKIIKLIDYNDSLHIYNSDKGAEKVKLISVNPQTNYE